MLGLSGNRWNEIYCGNATINTSDIRDKSILENPLGLDFVLKLKPIAWKWRKNGIRIHTGFAAQDVKAVLPNELDWSGWILGDKNDSNSIQGLRYTELIAPIVTSIQTHDITIINLLKSIDALEVRLNKLSI